MFSAQLRLVGTDKKQLQSFVDEVCDLLSSQIGAVVGWCFSHCAGVNNE